MNNVNKPYTVLIDCQHFFKSFHFYFQEGSRSDLSLLEVYSNNVEGNSAFWDSFGGGEGFVFYSEDFSGKRMTNFPERFSSSFSEKLSTSHSEWSIVFSSDDKSAKHSLTPPLSFEDVEYAIVIFLGGFVLEEEWGSFLGVFCGVASKDDSFVSIVDVLL